MQNIINGFFVFVILGTLMALVLRGMESIQWMISNLDYQCSNCGGYIYLSTWQAMLSFHFMGRKWVRCPHCGQMTWAVPIRRE